MKKLSKRLKNIEKRKISDEDRDFLVGVLKNPPAPTRSLMEAYERVSKVCHLDENGELVYDGEIMDA